MNKTDNLFTADRRAKRQKLYHSVTWRRLRAVQLQKQPLCVMCEQQGKITPASVCDHVDCMWPATLEGLTRGPFQSLCKQCHSDKSFEDVRKMARAERLKFQVSDEYE